MIDRKSRANWLKHSGNMYQAGLEASAFMEISPEQLVNFSKEWWIDIFTRSNVVRANA